MCEQIALISISHNSNVVESVNWTVGESSDDSEDLKFYVGLSRMVIDATINGTTVPDYIEFGSDSCDGYCEDCDNAASTIISSVVVAFITCK
jgi:hypothetical protein